jgi:hypothetical protein
MLDLCGREFVAAKNHAGAPKSMVTGGGEDFTAWPAAWFQRQIAW